MSEEKQRIKEILENFGRYLGTEEAKEHLKTMEKEKVEVKELMKKLSSMDSKSRDFTNLVLYGLLPYSKTEVAKRVSLFPAFMNIRAFFKEYNYDEREWNIIANKIFSLVKGFASNPGQLSELIEDFTKDKYSRRLQCGSITPILFCLNDSYPLVNNRTRRTYRSIYKILGQKNEIFQKLEEYPKNIEKLKTFVNYLDTDIIKNQDVLDLFCYWYDSKILSEERVSSISKPQSDDIRIEEVNIVNLVNSIDLEPAKYEPHTLRNPERIKIRDIINNVEKSWVLPNFQRYFDWTREDVRSFFDSIFRDYYVGAFLLWTAKQDSEPELDTMNIRGSEDHKIEKPGSIILDGQQRITSLYYAIRGSQFKLKGCAQPSYFYINFKSFFEGGSKSNLVITQNVRYNEEECFKRMLFPFYELGNYGDWINKFEDFLLKHESEIDKRKIIDIRRIIERRVKHIWDGFEIPYITLPETMGLKEVADIFENLNSKGKPLGVFDLLIARLLKYKIKMRELWDETRKEYPNIKRYFSKSQKIPIYIFQTISLTHHTASSCKREDILNIYENVYKESNYLFEKHWEEFSDYLDKAIKRLENLRFGYGVKSEKEVPFIPMLPILAALIKKIEDRTDKQSCYKKIDMWYWSSVFSNTYSQAVDSQLTSDYKELCKWFDDDTKIPKTVKTLRKEINVTVDLKGVQSTSNAMYKGVLSLLALEGARDFDTGQELENADNNQKDHIFPQSKKFGFGNLSDINSILNITWMSNNTNEKIKRSKKPSVYIPEFVKEKYNGDEKSFFDVLKTHFIDKNTYWEMIRDADGFDSFIETRNQLIMKKIKERIGWTEKDEILKIDEEVDLLKNEEGETLEFKSSFKKNMHTGQADNAMKFSVIKSIAGFLNNRGGKLILGYDEKNKQILGIEQDFEFTKFKDKDNFLLEFWSYLEANMDEKIVKDNIKIDFKTINGKEIMIIHIKPSDKSVYLKKNDKKILYVRKRNETEPIEDPEKIIEYVSTHFG